MNPRVFPITNDNTPTLQLLLTATTSIRDHRWHLYVPFKGLKYDNRDGSPAQPCLPFNLKGVSFNAPSGTRLLSAVPRRLNYNLQEPRATVIMGVDLWFESDITAAAFSATPLLLAFDGAANDAVNGLSTLSIPNVSATTGSPWTVTTSGSASIPIVVNDFAIPASRRFTTNWNASTNTPTLVSGTGTRGALYIVNIAGNTVLDGIESWAAGDELYYDGERWQKIPPYDSGLGTLAFKNDQEIVFHLDSSTGSFSLTSLEAKYQNWRLTGKVGRNISFKLPAGQQGIYRIIDETLRSIDPSSGLPYSISLQANGGQSGATAIGLRPETTELFVLNQFSASISVLNSQTGQLLRTLKPAGMNNPQGLAFNSDGSKAYVSTSDGKAFVIDLAGDDAPVVYNLNLADPALHTSALDLVVDTAHNLLWIACSGSQAVDIAQIARIDLTATEDAVQVLDVKHDELSLDHFYGLRHLRHNADFSEIYLWGSGGNGNAGIPHKCAYVLHPDDDNHFEHIEVGGNGGGGLDVDETTIYISRGGGSIGLFDLEDHDEIAGITGGNRLTHLLVDGSTLYCANTVDNTITVYDDIADRANSRLIRTPYGPGQLAAVTVGEERLLWTVFPDNNAVALLDPATGEVREFVELGPGAAVPVRTPIVEVVTDGYRLWNLAPEPDRAPRIPYDSPLLDLRDYFEREIVAPSDTNFLVWNVDGFVTADSSAAPFTKVIRTTGPFYDQFTTNYLPVRRGARLRFSVWLMRPEDAEGPGPDALDRGSFRMTVDQADKSLRVIGTAIPLEANPDPDGIWREYTATYDLPLTHTPVDNSDGGPVCYIRLGAAANQRVLHEGYDPDSDVQELQWSRVLVDYVDTARSQTLFAKAATATAHLQIGSATFNVARDATALQVQNALRAQHGDHENVIVTGGTADAGGGTYNGSFHFTWPDVTVLPPLTVTSPTNGTWITGLEQALSTAGPFTDLTDVPTDYTSHAGQLVAVKEDESGLEFVDPPSSLPAGGTQGQILTKASDVDGEANWAPNTGSNLYLASNFA